MLLFQGLYTAGQASIVEVSSELSDKHIAKIMKGIPLIAEFCCRDETLIKKG